MDSPCVHAESNDAAEVMGSFQETASRKIAENTVKHRDGSVRSVVANHCGGGESSVVVRTLPPNHHRHRGVLQCSRPSFWTLFPENCPSLQQRHLILHERTASPVSDTSATSFDPCVNAWQDQEISRQHHPPSPHIRFPIHSRDQMT